MQLDLCEKCVLARGQDRSTLAHALAQPASRKSSATRLSAIGTPVVETAKPSRRTPASGVSIAPAARTTAPPSPAPEPSGAADAAASHMGFYFCEKCGKRVTDADLEAGRARDKQLRGIYCEVCAEGARTLAFDAISQEELRRDEQKRHFSERRSTGISLPASKSIPGVSARRSRLHGVSKSPAFAIGACAAIAMVAIAAFLLVRSAPPGTGTPETRRGTGRTDGRTPEAPAAAVTPVPPAVQVPPVRPNLPNEAPVPVVPDSPATAGDPKPRGTAADGAQPGQTRDLVPPAASDVEGRARLAFDEMEVKLKQPAADDGNGRIALYEAFLQEHGTSIVAARVRTEIAEARKSVPADAGATSSPEHTGRTTAPPEATDEPPAVVEPPTTSPPAQNTELRVISFSLIDAATDQPIAAHDPLTDGVVLSYAQLGTSELNIRANIEGDVGCVLFVVDGKKSRQPENTAPYAMAGDTNGDYKAWKTQPGVHTVTAVPTSRANGKGLQGKPLTLSFTIQP